MIDSQCFCDSGRLTDDTLNSAEGYFKLLVNFSFCKNAEASLGDAVR